MAGGRVTRTPPLAGTRAAPTRRADRRRRRRRRDRLRPGGSADRELCGHAGTGARCPASRWGSRLRSPANAERPASWPNAGRMPGSHRPTSPKPSTRTRSSSRALLCSRVGRPQRPGRPFSASQARGQAWTCRRRRSRLGGARPGAGSGRRERDPGYGRRGACPHRRASGTRRPGAGLPLRDRLRQIGRGRRDHRSRREPRAASARGARSPVARRRPARALELACEAGADAAGQARW